VLRVTPLDDGATARRRCARARKSNWCSTTQAGAAPRRLARFGARWCWCWRRCWLGALLVVGNTVRLDIGSRREEIAVLQQLGATDGFIRRPFIYLGAGTARGRARALGLLALAAAAAAEPGALAGSYGSRFACRAPSRCGRLLLLAATALGWLGAWLASGTI
jgi:cell division transport system permease protein